METHKDFARFQACYLAILFSSPSYKEAITRLRTDPDVAQYFKDHELHPTFVEMAVRIFKHHALHVSDAFNQAESKI